MNLAIAHSICTGILLLAFVQPACSGDYSRLGWLPLYVFQRRTLEDYSCGIFTGWMPFVTPNQWHQMERGL